MRRVRVASLLLAVLCSSCGDSCACGSRAGKSNAGATGKPGKGASWVPPATAAGNTNGALVDGGIEPRAIAAGNPVWEPAPVSELTRRLEASKKAIETERVYNQLASEKALGGVLRDQLGKLKANGEASSSIRDDGATKLAVVARDYKAGHKSVRVKITDTALMPGARRSVSGHLTQIGNAATGYEHGTFVRGSPAVVGHLEADKVSRATALVGDRYLVQIVVRGAEAPDEALHLLEQIDFAGVAPKPGPKASKPL